MESDWRVTVGRLALAYGLSGIAVRQADGVALVVRGGRLVGAGAGAISLTGDPRR